MMKPRHFLPFLLLFCISSHGQVYFSKTYTFQPYFNFAKSVMTEGNDFVFTGNCSDTTSWFQFHRMFIAKADSAGNLYWEKDYGRYYANYWDGYWDAQFRFPNGNYVCPGSLEDTTGGFFQLYCFYPNGDTAWTKIFVRDTQSIFMDGEMNPDGSLTAIGYSSLSHHNRVMRFDENGSLLSDSSVASGSLYFSSMDRTLNNKYVFGGENEPANIDWTSYSLETDTNCNNPSYHSDPGSIIQDGSVNVAATSDSGYIAWSWKADSLTYFTNIMITDLPYIDHFDKNGSLMWRTDILPASYNVAFYVFKEFSDGNYYGAGYIDGEDGMYWGYIIKVDATGHVVWKRKNAKYFGSNRLNVPVDLQETPDHGMIISGYTYKTYSIDTIPNAAWLLRLDSNGCGQRSRPFGFSSSPASSPFGAGIQFSWQDTSGSNNGYIIERHSVNPPEPWHIISSTTTPWPTNFFHDSDLFINSTYCYCITAIDDQGRMSCSSDTFCVVALGQPEYYTLPLAINVYPVPADGIMNISFDNASSVDQFTDKILRIDVLDISGRTVLSSELSADDIHTGKIISIDTSGLSSSTYSIRISSEHYVPYTGKIIIIH